MTIESVYTYYKENSEAYRRQTATLKKRIHLLGSIRLALVVALGLSVWLFRAESGGILTAIVVLYALPFALLMIYHTKLFARKCYTEAMIRLNDDELKGLDYDFSAFDGAAEKSDAAHAFSLDLDLFGPQSLFQSVNRTVTLLGREQLADYFLSPLSRKEEILRRQEAIACLASHTQLRQHFYVTGKLRSGETASLHQLKALLEEKNQLLGKISWKWLIWVIPAGWLAIAAGYFAGGLPAEAGSIYFILSLLTAYANTRQINKLYQSVNKMESQLAGYSDLMKSFEGDQFPSAELTEICNQLTDGKQTASQAIRKLSTYIGGLDQRHSLAGILMNIFYLRDTRHALLLEKWKVQHAGEVTRWFDALARFDALCSLGGFAFNHPEYIYPEIADTYFRMEGKELGHPLLDRRLCVRNDISIDKKGCFLIVTGANMAGKSTYLRTVGVNFLLACMGAPACADALTVYPARLVTSLRTSDSLASNESYFFAELKRLKMIIDRLEQGEELFIILDEILKGTNSVDKQKGSLALVRQLVALRTAGIIATHDLALGDLADAFPGQVRNFRFEADIQKEELSFSYRLREGIAQNMNACFLMQKMGIGIRD